MDRFMSQFIKIGGLAIIVAVFGIFAFILVQVIPLFQGAQVKEAKTVELPKAKPHVLDVDEWGPLPFLLKPYGGILFVDLRGHRGVIETNPFPANVETSSVAYPTITSAAYDPHRGNLICGTSDGKFSLIRITYSASDRTVEQTVEAAPLETIGKPGAAIFAIGLGDTGDNKLIAAIQQTGDQAELHAVTMSRKRSLLGGGVLKVDGTYDLTTKLSGKPTGILINSTADGILVPTTSGDVQYFFRAGNEFELRQTFRPFKDLKDATISSLQFLFGDVSVVATSVTGENRVFSLYVPPGGSTRLFGQTKEFERLPGPATFYAASVRNKAFLTGSGQTASLRYGTTESIRWQEKLPFVARSAAISGKYDKLLFVDTDNRLHVFDLYDPHPDASVHGLFGKVWYEGYSAKRYAWQSTGGSDEFESKFSLTPLIIGTLKGTLYAMLFAVPIALLAAIYTSEFLHPNLRVFIKPTMEIMASLPSVVLGFLAALWLAPVLETRIPAFILLVIAAPLSAFVFGAAWSRLPIRYRHIIRPGYEFIVFLPVLLMIVYGVWQFGPAFERWFFVVGSGSEKVADFRLWWPHITGAKFEQRNSLVVGFMMGFAVIPIIFTISEDAISNVPGALRSGSLALGASRWQTAMRVVLPTASAGIFSAMMIGLGRAVGETMIVVMATGNTPLMDFNIFSGMRTLSANIAVELPEAPLHSTLYRALFLGAMILFLMTFVVNTVAEILRQHLREKYKTI